MRPGEVAVGADAPPSGNGDARTWHDLWLTNRVLEQLGPCMDRQELLERLHSVAGELFPHDASILATVKQDEPMMLDVALAHGFDQLAGTLPSPFAPRLLIDPWELGAGPLHIPDLQATPLQLGDLFQGTDLRSLLSIPLTTGPGSGLEAVLVLAHRAPGAFADISDRSLDQFQKAVSGPLTNALRVLEQQEHAADNLAVAARLWEVVTTEPALAVALPQLLAQALAVAGADAGTIMVVMPESEELFVRASAGMRTRVAAGDQVPWGTRAAAPVRQMDGPRFLAPLPPEGPPAIHAPGEGFVAYLGLPVYPVADHPAAALLNLYWRTVVAEPSGERLLLLQSVARAVGAALAQADLEDWKLACERVSAQFSEHKARMLSLIGHQLRTPITSIKGFAQLLLRRTSDPESPTARYAGTILEESKRLGVLIDNVVELSRLEGALIAMQARPFDLLALLQDLRGDLSLRSLVASALLTWDLPARLPIVVGDPLRLKQALIALLRRARARAPQDSGPLRIQARTTTLADRPTVMIAIGSAESGRDMAEIDDLLTMIDLRSVVDNQNAQEDELALYSAMQLLQAMRATLRLESDAAGHARYVVTVAALEEL